MDIKIAISTNKNFYKLSLPIIIDSLLSTNIDKKQIFIFNSGYDYYLEDFFDGIKIYFLKQNSYEYSPLIHICEKNIISDYFFLIHDTCKVGVNFKNLLYNIPKEMPDKIALKKRPSMSIGLYKYNYLMSIKEKLFKIKNIDYSEESMQKWKKWGVANEDYILWKTSPDPLIYPSISNWSVVDYINWYNTGTIRRTEYYPSLDIYKNKSNWGQTSHGKMVVSL